MAKQENVVETNQRDFGPDEQGFYRALMAEIAEREALVAGKSPVTVAKVSTPPGSTDAVGMYSGQ